MRATRSKSQTLRCSPHPASCGLAARGAGTPKIDATVSALRFFFSVTLDRPDLAKHPEFMREPRNVPVVLSPEEAAMGLGGAAQSARPSDADDRRCRFTPDFGHTAASQ